MPGRPAGRGSKKIADRVRAHRRADRAAEQVHQHEVAARGAGDGHPLQCVGVERLIKNLRGRYGSAGSKDDRFDAYVLADTLRTDRARLAPLTPDSPATVTLRRACRARKDLVTHRVAVANQLRAHLRNAFPGAAGLFAEIDSPISLKFLARFSTQDRAAWLSPRRLAAWLASAGYCGRTDPAILHARLAAAPAAPPVTTAPRKPTSPQPCTPS